MRMCVLIVSYVLLVPPPPPCGESQTPHAGGYHTASTRDGRTHAKSRRLKFIQYNAFDCKYPKIYLLLLLGMEQDLNTRLANLSLQIQDVGDWRLTVTEPKFITK